MNGFMAAETPGTEYHAVNFEFFNPPAVISAESGVYEMLDFCGTNDINTALKGIVGVATEAFNESHPDITNFRTVCAHVEEHMQETFQLVGDTKTGSYVVIQVNWKDLSWTDVATALYRFLGSDFITKRLIKPHEGVDMKIADGGHCLAGIRTLRGTMDSDSGEQGYTDEI